MKVEVSSQTSSVTISGVTEPIISQRISRAGHPAQGRRAQHPRRHPHQAGQHGRQRDTPASANSPSSSTSSPRSPRRPSSDEVVFLLIPHIVRESGPDPHQHPRHRHRHRPGRSNCADDYRRRSIRPPPIWPHAGSSAQTRPARPTDSPPTPPTPWCSSSSRRPCHPRRLILATPGQIRRRASDQNQPSQQRRRAAHQLHRQCQPTPTRPSAAPSRSPSSRSTAHVTSTRCRSSSSSIPAVLATRQRRRRRPAQPRRPGGRHRPPRRGQRPRHHLHLPSAQRCRRQRTGKRRHPHLEGHRQRVTPTCPSSRSALATAPRPIFRPSVRRPWCM